MSSTYNTRTTSFHVASGNDDFNYCRRNMRSDFSSPVQAARASTYRSSNARTGGDEEIWRQRGNDQRDAQMSLEHRSYEGRSAGERLMNIAFFAVKLT